MEKAPHIKSKASSFQKAFFLKIEKIITSNGPKPAIDIPVTENPAPAFNAKKVPINGASIQTNQETKFGLVPLLKILLTYQTQENKFITTPIQIIFSGSIID